MGGGSRYSAVACDPSLTTLCRRAHYSGFALSREPTTLCVVFFREVPTCVRHCLFCGEMDTYLYWLIFFFFHVTGCWMRFWTSAGARRRSSARSALPSINWTRQSGPRSDSMNGLIVSFFNTYTFCINVVSLPKTVAWTICKRCMDRYGPRADR